MAGNPPFQYFEVSNSEGGKREGLAEGIPSASRSLIASETDRPGERRGGATHFVILSVAR